MAGLVLLSALLCSVESVQAELVVIVNVDRDVEQVSQPDIVNIFMGRRRQLADGLEARPIDVKGEAAERKNFYEKLLGKNLSEIDAYWARLIFSGRTSPPFALETVREVLDRVARDRTAIGYIDRNQVNDRVKVVHALPE